jgi:hypothetical protein
MFYYDYRLLFARLLYGWSVCTIDATVYFFIHDPTALAVVDLFHDDSCFTTAMRIVQ